VNTSNINNGTGSLQTTEQQEAYEQQKQQEAEQQEAYEQQKQQ
jgi:hypothetical protein